MGRRRWRIWFALAFGLMFASLGAIAAERATCPPGAKMHLQFRAIEPSEGEKRFTYAAFTLTNAGKGERWFGLDGEEPRNVLHVARADLQSRQVGSNDDWVFAGLLAEYFEANKWLVLGPKSTAEVLLTMPSKGVGGQEYRLSLRDKDGCEAVSEGFRL